MKNGPYILIVSPKDYPGKKYRDQYIYEHIYIWWKNTGKLPKKNEVVHHKNENKHDNRFENLNIHTKSSHTSHHSDEREIIEMVCFNCKKKYNAEARNIRSREKTGQKNHHCSRSCQVTTQQIKRHKKSKI